MVDATNQIGPTPHPPCGWRCLSGPTRRASVRFPRVSKLFGVASLAWLLTATPSFAEVGSRADRISLSFRPTRIQDLLATTVVAGRTDAALGGQLSGHVIPVGVNTRVRASAERFSKSQGPGTDDFQTKVAPGGPNDDGQDPSRATSGRLSSFAAFSRAAEALSTPWQVRRSVGLGDGAADRGGDLTPREDDDRFGYSEPHGEFDLYEISMALPAGSLGPVSVNWIGGLRAVRADVSTERTESGASGETYSTLDTARGVVAVPIVGTGVSWALGKSFEVFGHATTHTGADTNSLIDLTAAASIQLSPGVDLHAGYQEIRGRFDVRGIEAELDQRGLFARLRIRF